MASRHGDVDNAPQGPTGARFLCCLVWGSYLQEAPEWAKECRHGWEVALAAGNTLSQPCCYLKSYPSEGL